MKITRSLCVFLYTLIMGTSCHTSEIEAAGQAPLESITSQKELLREKINTEDSRIILSPENAHRIKSLQPATVSTSSLLSSVGQISGSAVSRDFHVNGNNWDEAETDMHVVRANLDRYLFDIYQKEGVLEEPVKRTDPGLPDDIFFSKTQDMLAAMGVFEEEAEKHEVWRLMRASRSTKINGELLDPALEDKVTVQPVMKKASYYREVGGIPVLGNRLTFSFTLDGRFLSASGRWPVLDYASSQITADMQEPEFTNLMLNRVFESGISSEEAESIYLRTFYRAEKGSNGKHFLNMYGGAIVLRKGIKGRDRKMEIEEDI